MPESAAEETAASLEAAGLEEVISPPSMPSAGSVATMGWTELKSAVAVCTKCGLCQGRTQSVFGVGDEKAKWLFVGEGPGRNEDLTGEPFVGKAGKLLDNILLSMGLKRGENAYIANIVKCRPTDATGKDRPPTPDETAACMPYLERQIELIQPSILVALGKTAALSLLGLDPETPVSKLRGKVHQYAGRPLVVTYHPAYLLRNMSDKRKTWADLCLAMATYANAG
jgi:DNA polymerase